MNEAVGSGLLLPLPGILSLYGPCQARLDRAQIILPNRTYLMRYEQEQPSHGGMIRGKVLWSRGEDI